MEPNAIAVNKEVVLPESLSQASPEKQIRAIAIATLFLEYLRDGMTPEEASAAIKNVLAE